METIQISTLEDLVPYLSQYILPHVKESVQVCVRAFTDDPFNDNWTFGTHLWKNTWNRIRATAEIENNPITAPIRGNEYYFSIGNATIHHHRVGGASLLPNAAKAVKALVDEAQLPLFPHERKLAFDNVILGISADPMNGLSEVFLGKLEKDASSEQYFWSKRVSLYNMTTAEPEEVEYIFVEEEEEAIPVLTLAPKAKEIAQPAT
jgi:hypothetical protein